MQIIIKKYSLQKLSYAPNRLSIQFSNNDLTPIFQFFNL